MKHPASKMKRKTTKSRHGKNSKTCTRKCMKSKKCVKKNKCSKKKLRKSSKKSSKKTKSHAKKRKYHKKKHPMKGGEASCGSSGPGSFGNPAAVLVPGVVTDAYRSTLYGMGSAYSAINGYDAPLDPMPYADQLGNAELPEDTLLRA